MSLESQINALELPVPQGQEDLNRYARRVALIGAYIGAAYGVANNPPTIGYVATGEPNRNDLLRDLFLITRTGAARRGVVAMGVHANMVMALRKAGLPVDEWENGADPYKIDEAGPSESIEVNMAALTEERSE